MAMKFTAQAGRQLGADEEAKKKCERDQGFEKLGRSQSLVFALV